MDEDEAALLAELRAIQSASSRFDEDDGNDDDATLDSNRAAAPSRPRPSPRRPELDPVSQRRSEADASELDSKEDSFSLMSISSLSQQKSQQQVDHYFQ